MQKMTFRLDELVAMEDALLALSALRGGFITAAVAFRLANMTEAIQKQIEGYRRVRMGLYQRMGEKKGNQYIVAPEKIEELNRELTGLNAETVEIPVEIVRLPADAPGLSADDVRALRRLIVIPGVTDAEAEPDAAAAGTEEEKTATKKKEDKA
jgi:hypothetical protein